MGNWQLAKVQLKRQAKFKLSLYTTPSKSPRPLLYETPSTVLFSPIIITDARTIKALDSDWGKCLIKL
jgi:hypothetical protein